MLIFNEYDLLTKQETEIISRLGFEFNGNALKNKLYFNTNGKTIYDYDPQTQKLNNIIVDNETTFISSGVILNDKIYFGTTNGKIYEYDPATQKSKIVTILDSAIHSSGIVLNNKLYFGTFSHVYEYNPIVDEANEIFEKWYKFLAHDELKIEFNFNTVNKIRILFEKNKKQEFIKELKIIVNKIPKSDHSGAGGAITKEDVNTIANIVWQHFPDFHETFENLTNSQKIIIKTNTIGYWDVNNPNNSIYIN
ncbi:hypothetical protein [Spiroplasma endosymbiont of 'Nebria riversi']|uniref:hypothetical protein n=1 Tax=Spiroplasma endosymbiont of 'Nebria riversi' TaxID=2792084 RepID=UPI001C03AA3F|nr:hypothetical protein [Spiroplasma endosymbiont of 'Nebria riversi']